MATYQCEICGVETLTFSRYRGAYCERHWPTAQAMDAGEKLNNRLSANAPAIDMVKELADLKARIREACLAKDKAQA